MSRRISIAAGLMVLLLSAPSAVAQEDTVCFRAPQLAAGAQFAAANMTVARNGRCSHSSRLSDLRIDTQPRNGRLEGGTGGLTYIPNPNFTGSDSYVYSGNAAAARGRAAGATGRVSITVSISVQ